MMSKTSSTFDVDAFQQSSSQGPVFINLLLDDWFKRAFTRKDILLLTLQMILPEKNISDVKLVRNEHTNPFPLAKNVLIDVECVTQDGARFIVELQKERQDHFQERILYYSSFAIQQQVPRGEKLYDFMPVYMISLLNFSFHEKEKGEVKFVYQITRNGREDELMTEKVTYIYIKMPNHRSLDDPANAHQRVDRNSFWKCFSRSERASARRPGRVFAQQIRKAGKVGFPLRGLEG